MSSATIGRLQMEKEKKQNECFKVFFCTFCKDVAFASLENLDTHVSKRHEDEVRGSCSRQSTTFCRDKLYLHCSKVYCLDCNVYFNPNYFDDKHSD